MAFKRRYGGRRNFRRRTRRRYGRRPRYSRYLRKRSRVYRRGGGTINKMLKALLPVVPLKYAKTYYGLGSYGSRTWFSDVVGSVDDANNYKEYLPGQSNIYDDGSTGTSTHLSFQQFSAKKFKMRHIETYTGQNVANTTMLLTAHVVKFRRDYEIKNAPDIVTDFLSTDSAATTNSGGFRIDKNSSLPATSYIGNYYNYPQFTMFMSPTTCSYLKVVKTKKFRIPPGGWFKFKLNTGWHEFDKAWLNVNGGATQPIHHLRNWSKMLVLTWHGELAQKVSAINTVTLAATDFIMYGSNSITLKAVPYQRKSVILQPPVNLVTTTPLPWNPQVRPKVVVQINKTGQATEDDAAP